MASLSLVTIACGVPAGASTPFHEVASNPAMNSAIAGTSGADGERLTLDTAQYPKGLAVSDANLSAINIERNEFHGDWNYCIHPV